MWEDKNYFRWVNQLSPFHGELVGFSHCDSTYYQARKESDVTVLEYVTKGTGNGDQNGTFKQITALDVLDNGKKIIVADSLKLTLTVFCETAYGAELKAAQKLTLNGDYAASRQKWKKIIVPAMKSTVPSPLMSSPFTMPRP